MCCSVLVLEGVKRVTEKDAESGDLDASNLVDKWRVRLVVALPGNVLSVIMAVLPCLVVEWKLVLLPCLDSRCAAPLQPGGLSDAA